MKPATQNYHLLRFAAMPFSTWCVVGFMLLFAVFTAAAQDEAELARYRNYISLSSSELYSRGLKYEQAGHDDSAQVYYADWGNVADAQGQNLGRRHLLYVPKYDDYNVGENLLTTVEFGIDGAPLYRITPDGNGTHRLSDITPVRDKKVV